MSDKPRVCIECGAPPLRVSPRCQDCYRRWASARVERCHDCGNAAAIPGELRCADCADTVQRVIHNANAPARARTPVAARAPVSATTAVTRARFLATATRGEVVHDDHSPAADLAAMAARMAARE